MSTALEEMQDMSSWCCKWMQGPQRVAKSVACDVDRGEPPVTCAYIIIWGPAHCKYNRSNSTASRALWRQRYWLSSMHFHGRWAVSNAMLMNNAAQRNQRWQTIVRVLIVASWFCSHLQALDATQTMGIDAHFCPEAEQRQHRDRPSSPRREHLHEQSAVQRVWGWSFVVIAGKDLLHRAMEPQYLPQPHGCNVLDTQAQGLFLARNRASCLWQRIRTIMNMGSHASGILVCAAPYLGWCEDFEEL